MFVGWKRGLLAAALAVGCTFIPTRTAWAQG